MSEQMWHNIKRIVLVGTFLPLAAVLALPTPHSATAFYDTACRLRLQSGEDTEMARKDAGIYLGTAVYLDRHRDWNAASLPLNRLVPTQSAKKLKLVDRMLAVAEDGTCPDYTIPLQENSMLCLVLRLASAELDA